MVSEVGVPRIRPDRHGVRAERGRSGRDVDSHDPIGIDHVRRRADEEPVHDAEHRRVRADTEPQRQDRSEREPRAPGQCPQRMAKILEEGVHRATRASAHPADPPEPPAAKAPTPPAGTRPAPLPRRTRIPLDRTCRR